MTLNCDNETQLLDPVADSKEITSTSSPTTTTQKVAESFESNTQTDTKSTEKQQDHEHTCEGKHIYTLQNDTQQQQNYEHYAVRNTNKHTHSKHTRQLGHDSRTNHARSINPLHCLQSIASENRLQIRTITTYIKHTIAHMIDHITEPNACDACDE